MMQVFSTNKRRLFRSILGAAAMTLSCVSMSFAQNFPAKPVALVVPYPPGGTSDIMARALASRMSDSLGQTVIVENLGGTTGAIAARRVLRDKPDGHQIYVGSPNELILGPMSTTSPVFNSEDFRMVGKVGDLTLATITRGTLPVNSTEELIAYAKQRADAGTPLTYGSVGLGSLYHLLGEKMVQLTGAL